MTELFVVLFIKTNKSKGYANIRQMLCFLILLIF